MAKPLQPATGSVCWIDHDEASGLHWMRITTETGSASYQCQQDTDGMGWTLWTIDRRTLILKEYHVRNVPGFPNCYRCNCPDATNRPERQFCCKHIRGLRAALPKLPF